MSFLTHLLNLSAERKSILFCFMQDTGLKLGYKIIKVNKSLLVEQENSVY